MVKMILDLDTGVDDALAIAYACASAEVDLLGITGTYGNVLMETGLKNASQLLDLFGQGQVLVYPGLDHASDKEDFEVQEVSALIHGKNGLGEVDLGDRPVNQAAGNAVDFILESARKYGKDLKIVATGPMTNLAAAIDKDLDSLSQVGEIVIMGGALTVCGNVSAFAEANISQDPAAADKLFRSGLPVTMVGLDVTLRTLLTYKETQIWRDLGTEAGEKMADIVDYYIKSYEVTSPHLKGCALHDPLAVAVAVQGDLVDCLPLAMKVETEGESRGRTIGDNDRLNDPDPSVRVAVAVDVDRFLNEFMTRLTQLFKEH
ncbi:MULTISPECIES: nucleoside hydrolase [Aerococcus]|uniref:nucleoside hydrolase n=1 Tax=Aerococcus urinae (strain CCUG 59500 / ACS-120-V-Col10a) TaxID=2976812 RepID=UPI000200E7B4|nr:nucleoside hydrolase [Aerococcus sp. Group 1]AEA01859.1 Inosine-uridine preferring nucleoside hydrolase [Aerococcus sp. Group 1]MCY3030038.1 nucleoside hydrolase [Aerococcus sp. Group 1]MCY3054755.1 nucleoside hydrolase [Aerococcus sp. Group 1]MCY3056485.1 nucleoside hydrolase [Aerococcus sp. Group 1]MCY3061164.1 nucleoside hydrolase [Aerococcus sp. Group 1]